MTHFDNSTLLKYKVGALMYVPAIKHGIAEKLCAGVFSTLSSIAFCLEDAISDSGVKQAENQLVNTLSYINEHPSPTLPLLFVRVRNCSQFRRLPSILGDLTNLLTGIIFPKFDLTNAAEYFWLTGRINSEQANPLYVMPILESAEIIDVATRTRTLLGLRELADGCKDYILNIRVGAMDFCKHHGLRRTVNQSSYDIGIINSVLTDILTIFADNYIVSAPVWEYFQSNDNDNSWAAGMENEICLDMANGFIGKTVIHPSQIPIVRKWLSPVRTDYDDASSILNWEDNGLGVSKSAAGNRMNELATHKKWAEKVLILAHIYGVRDV